MLHRWLYPSLLALPLLVLFAAVPASAQILRYTAVARGDVAIAGNTLGLAKSNGANGPGTEGSIGTFIASDSGSVDDTPPNPGNPWPSATTNDWTANGSEGPLALPAGSLVLYAELFWGGSYDYGSEDVSASLDTTVTLRGPSGATTSVTPDPATAATIITTTAGGLAAVRDYVRSANVTAFVGLQGAGSYEVRGVPGTQDESVETFNAAGWAMIVAYAHDASPHQTLSVVAAGAFVDESSGWEGGVTNLSTPEAGLVTGRIVVAASEGDAHLVGDQLSIGTGDGSYSTLSGANNPVNNFFASQINDVSGQLETSGSFGTDNHTANAGINNSGARQGWDVTGLALSSAAGELANGQTTASVRATTTGDSYVLVGFGLAIENGDFPAVPGLEPFAGVLAAIAVGVLGWRIGARRERVQARPNRIGT